MEELASTQGDNEEILKLLAAELDLRTTRRARRLRRTLGFVVSLDSTGPSTEAVPENDEGRDSEANLAFQDAGEWVARYTVLTGRYEILRATFTLEAELLARWGMTPLLPTDLQNLVFEEWRKKLNASTEGFDRTLETLKRDRARIAQERATAKGSKGKKDATEPNNFNET